MSEINTVKGFNPYNIEQFTRDFIKVTRETFEELFKAKGVMSAKKHANDYTEFFVQFAYTKLKYRDYTLEDKGKFYWEVFDRPFTCGMSYYTKDVASYCSDPDARNECYETFMNNMQPIFDKWGNKPLKLDKATIEDVLPIDVDEINSIYFIVEVLYTLHFTPEDILNALEINISFEERRILASECYLAIIEAHKEGYYVSRDSAMTLYYQTLEGKLLQLRKENKCYYVIGDEDQRMSIGHALAADILSILHIYGREDFVYDMDIYQAAYNIYIELPHVM